MPVIEFSNRYEILSQRLLQRLEYSPTPLFQAEHIIVPSTAIKRQLTYDIARKLGICANVEFCFLGRWLWQTVARVNPQLTGSSPFEPERLVWRVFALLSEADWQHAHPRLATYLQHADAVMRLELAGQIVEVFNDYITYRPDWLELWSRQQSVDLVSADQDWQAALWRHLTDMLLSCDANPLTEFVRHLDERAVSPQDLPKQVHLFCLPSMPPLYLQVLNGLARHIDIHCYVLNPCREYWFEVIDSKRLAYLTANAKADYHETGNRLLAAWGKQTQAHVDLLLEYLQGAEDHAEFLPAEADSLLASLQNAILDLVDLAPGSCQLADDDRSIEVHVCHSLSRELEVLQDYVLALLVDDPTLTPGDILVALPQLDEVAPLIDAVFASVSKPRFIPYNITGLGRSRINPIARCMLDLLALLPSRWAASEVFGLLQQAPLARRYRLDTDGLEQIRQWLHQSGIRWALDGEHRQALGLPPTERHSFADGLDRLFLAYAMPAGAETPFAGKVAAGNPEGSKALTLGAFNQFIDDLASFRHHCAAPKLPQAWAEQLKLALHTFMAASDEDIEDWQEVVQCISTLSEQWRQAEFDQPLPLELVRHALSAELEVASKGAVPSGLLTFASINGLRSLPYRVVCLLNLSDGVFPGNPRQAEFDLLAHNLRRGDRQRRMDDRAVFLDLLLAARDRLYLSYSGRSIRDNALLPPSVLLAELLDYLLPVLAGDAAQAKARLVVEHPLQAFAESAFAIDSDPRIRSFNDEFAAALLQRRQAPIPLTFAASDHTDDDDEDADSVVAQAFFTSALPPASAEWRSLSLQQLLRFLQNPCRYLLQQRLGLHRARDEDELRDDEAFLVELPARSALAERILSHLLAGEQLAQVRQLALCGTEMPMGTLGEQALDQELHAMQAFADDYRQQTASPCLPPFNRQLALHAADQDWQLQIAFADLRSAGLVRCRYDDARAGDYLHAWLQHLALCAAQPPEVELTTQWLCRDRTIRFKTCHEAKAELEQLLALYWQGLSEPLYFFPKSAWAYLADGENLNKARGKWQPSPRNPYAEGADAAYRLALRGKADPFATEGQGAFISLAKRVLQPLLHHLETDV